MVATESCRNDPLSLSLSSRATSRYLGGERERERTDHIQHTASLSSPTSPLCRNRLVNVIETDILKRGEDLSEQSGIFYCFIAAHTVETRIICCVSAAFGRRFLLLLRLVALQELFIVAGGASFCVALQLFIHTPTSASCFSQIGGFISFFSCFCLNGMNDKNKGG